MPIASEIRNNTADSRATDFRLLEAASGISAEIICSKIDVHMTGSTSHKNGMAENLSEIFHRKEIAGQIFCDNHLTFRFDKGIAKIIHATET